MTFWHVDDSVRAGTVRGRGVNFAHVRHSVHKGMPFLHGGYAEHGGSLLQKTISGFVLCQVEPGPTCSASV